MPTAIERREQDSGEYRRLFEEMLGDLNTRYPGVNLDAVFTYIEMSTREDISRQQRLEWLHQVTESQEERINIVTTVIDMKLDFLVEDTKRVQQKAKTKPGLLRKLYLQMDPEEQQRFRDRVLQQRKLLAELKEWQAETRQRLNDSEDSLG